MSAVGEKLLRDLLAHFRGKERMTVSEWAERYRILPKAMQSAGRWRNSQTPYLVEIMDCMSESSPVQEVTLCCSAQLGKSEAGYNVIGYTMHSAPCNMILTLPTDELVETTSKQRIRTLLADTPELAELVSQAHTRNEKNTIKSKEFPGGMLLMVSMRAAASLRAVPARVVVNDEVDAAPLNIAGEGDPFQLIKNRQNTFRFNKKRLNTGTPLVQDTSRLWAEYEKTDQRHYFVPCPSCGNMHTLEWENVHWDVGRPETAGMVCPHCQTKFHDHDKPDILPRGEWRPTVPEKFSETRRGYHMSGLYSPYGWMSLQQVVESHIDSEMDEHKRQVHVNTVMGRPFAMPGYRPEDAHWQKQRVEVKKGAQCPADAMVLTAGCDTQYDHVQVYVYAWGVGEKCWPVDFHVVHGDLSDRQFWIKAIYPLVHEARYKTEDGRVMAVAADAIDTGGRWTSEVYRHVQWMNRNGRANRSIAIRGARAMQAPIVQQRPSLIKRKDIANRVKLYPVGVHSCKLTLYGKINAGDLKVPTHWAKGAEIDEAYFREMTAEKLTKRVKPSGFVDWVWSKKEGQRNEAMDCWNYAYAALKHLHVNWSDLVDREARRSEEGDKIEKPKLPTAPQHGKNIVRVYRSPKPTHSSMRRPRRTPDSDL